MPTILRIGLYRFFFYSNENGEPAHIHIQRESALAKFWLHPVCHWRVQRDSNQLNCVNYKN